MEAPFLRRAWMARWHAFRASLWYLPSLLTLGAIGLYAATIYLDRRLGLQLSPRALPPGLNAVLFSGGPSAAQALLTNISGMWATIVGVSFSVTLVTIQLTATKYIAQVLPLFERDRTNQFVLGAYLATVTYALLVAKTIHIEPPTFVPYISVNVALALAIASIFLLILFVANTVNLVRPQFFLDQTLRDAEANLARERGPSRRWRVSRGDLGEDPQAPPGARAIRAGARGVLREVAWEELAQVLRRHLADAPAAGPWRLHLAKAVGDPVRRGEVLAYLVHPDGVAARERVEAAIIRACEVGPHNQPSDNVDGGIEALAALTIKGAVQGDLDVTFAGVDGLFELLAPLARLPRGPERFELVGAAATFVAYQPATDLLGKWVREMTVVSEVALAPSLPFRLVAEGISSRFAAVLIQLAEDGDWEAFDRILAEVRAWYESAFFHVGWVNGMHHLAHDLAKVAIRVHGLDGGARSDVVVGHMWHHRERLAADAQAREALDEALQRIDLATRGPTPPS